MLFIFLIVLGVIGKWVVPPISKVLAEREAMLAKTAADNKKAAEQMARLAPTMSRRLRVRGGSLRHP